MNGIHSRYSELLEKIDITFLSESILNNKYDGNSENILIDVQRDSLEQISILSSKLPEKDGERLMLNVIEYIASTESLYFYYGLKCGGKLISQLTK